MFEIAIITAICLGSVLVSYAAFRRGASKSADDYFVAGCCDVDALLNLPEGILPRRAVLRAGCGVDVDIEYIRQRDSIH